MDQWFCDRMSEVAAAAGFFYSNSYAKGAKWASEITSKSIGLQVHSQVAIKSIRSAATTTTARLSVAPTLNLTALNYIRRQCSIPEWLGIHHIGIEENEKTVELARLEAARNTVPLSPHRPLSNELWKIT